jgi:glycosyltransferase involved in cell wall biosynthesis
MRKIPFVVSIHGGVLDLPIAAKEHLLEPLKGGVEWGKLFGAPLRSRRVLEEADAIITCNKTEAALLNEKYPQQRVVAQPHGVPAADFCPDHRAAAKEAFPAILGKRILLAVGRIDTVKNQGWLVEQAPELIQKFPDVLFVVAGSCTDSAYGDTIKCNIEQRGLSGHFLLTGGLPPGDPRLIGLFQEARALVLPSISEPFGLVILESWAAGTPVISNRASGARELICPGKNGWLFDLAEPGTFHSAAAEALTRPDVAKRCGMAGQELVREQFDSTALAGGVKKLYEELIEVRHEIRHTA